jgi:hypothetical protein
MGTLFGGGASRDRTGDLYNAIVALSQLSYGPATGKTRILGSDRELVKRFAHIDPLALPLRHRRSVHVAADRQPAAR